MLPPTPTVGERIYIDHTDVHYGLYLRGGLATVTGATVIDGRIQLEFAEVPGGWWWDELVPIQDELRRAYRDSPAGTIAWRPL